MLPAALSGVTSRRHTGVLAETDADLGTAPLGRRPEPVPEGYTVATAPTVLLPFDLTQLHVLPVGAILDHRYVVKTQVQVLAGRNLYRADVLDQHVARHAARWPPWTPPVAPAADRITGQPPLRSYLVAESLDRDEVVRDRT